MDAKQREHRRMEAIKRLRAGAPAAVFAADLGAAPNTVYAWGKLARDGGTKALKSVPKSVPKSGRPVKLARTQWAAVKHAILKSPTASGFDRELWTLPMIGEFIRRTSGVTYHEDHLSRFVRRLGLSVQKPVVRARERDDKAIKRFADNEFPRIEKKRGDAARP
jgi:transposase